INDATRQLKSMEAVDSTLRFVEDSVSLSRVLKKTESIASPLLERIGRVRDIFRLCRLAYTFKYIVSGALYHDVRNFNVRPLITEAAFLLQRAIGAAHFAVSQKLTTWGSLAVKAGNVGGVRAFNLVMKLQKPQVTGVLFLVALTGLAIPEA